MQSHNIEKSYQTTWCAAISVLLFGALIAGPLIGTALQSSASQRKLERLERRKLTQAPALKISSQSIFSFPTRFEAYFNDRFGFRRELVSLYSTLRFRIFGVSPSPRVLVGQNGWFYAGLGTQEMQHGRSRGRDNLSDWAGRAQYRRAELEQWRRTLEERQRFLKQYNIDYIFAIAPAKYEIYPEFLPGALASERKSGRMNQLINYLRDNSSVTVVDSVPVLEAARKLELPAPLFLRTDGHWNALGAFYFYRSIIDKAAEIMPERGIVPLKLEQFKIKLQEHWFHAGFAAQMGFKVHEDRPVLQPVGDNPLRGIKRTKSSDLPGYAHIYNSKGGPLNSILILGDSYIEKSFNFFSAHAKHTYRKREIRGFDTKFFDQMPPQQYPQVVVQEISQGYLMRKLPTNRKDVRMRLH